MKERIDPLANASRFLAALPTGILLTTMADNRVNVMTIGWGTLGVEWGAPIFITYVRENRFSRSNLDKNPYFTINAPAGDYDRKILGVAGTKSGRDLDKVAYLGLTLEHPEKINVPGIRELPLTLECAVIYRRPQAPELIPQKFREQFYPQHVDSSAPLANRDYHVAYYGMVVDAYVIR